MATKKTSRVRKLPSARAKADYGILTDYKTGEQIRKATKYERDLSRLGPQSGAFLLGNRVVFVAE